MPFKSNKQAYFLMKNKPKVFRSWSRKYGMPKGWHAYKKARIDMELDIKAYQKRVFKEKYDPPKRK